MLPRISSKEEVLSDHGLLMFLRYFTSLPEGGGGLRAKVRHVNFFSMVKFPTLGTGNLFKSNNISLSAFKKTAVWCKIWGQNPQDWNKGSFQMLHLCCTPHLRINIFVPASQGCALAEPGGCWCPTFALGWLENSYKSYAKHPRFYRFRALGSLQFP